MTSDLKVPSVIPNQIGAHDRQAGARRTFPKLDPASGRIICEVARSGAPDVAQAVAAAKAAQPGWAAATVVARGDVLRRIAMLMLERRLELAELVSRETGKSK